MQHILASLKPNGRAAVVLDTGAASRGSGNANSNKEKEVRQWFVEQDFIEGVTYPIRRSIAGDGRYPFAIRDQKRLI